jgi:hypothetical protein
MLNVKRLLLFSLGIILLAGCQKEYSLETGGVPNPGGGNNLSTYGWIFTGNPAADYHGCIDTAYYQTINGFKTLQIQGTDSANNSFNIILISQSGNIGTGTFTVSQGATMTVLDNNGNQYTVTPDKAFSLVITKVNDTLVEGSFSGTLTNPLDNSTFKVTGGQLKALIGKSNPCGGSSNPGGVSDAQYVMQGTGGNCANFAVRGNYFKGTKVTPTEYVQLTVNVSIPGDWNLSTPAVNGVTFSGSGTFTNTGTQTIILDASGTPTQEGNNTFPVSAGNSSCSFNVNVQPGTIAVPGPGDYFPTTTNSNWIYYLMDLSTGAVDSAQTISTGATTTISGQTYSVFQNDLFGSVYRKVNGVYYRYGPIDFAGAIDSTKKAETVFLKENDPVNSTWESPVIDAVYSGTPVKFKRKFTISAKNVSITVKGTTFNNVITVKEDFMVDVSGLGFQQLEETVVSYAKGIGLIQLRNDVYGVGLDVKRYQVF